MSILNKTITIARSNFNSISLVLIAILINAVEPISGVKINYETLVLTVILISTLFFMTIKFRSPEREFNDKLVAHTFILLLSVALYNVNLIGLPVVLISLSPLFFIYKNRKTEQTLMRSFEQISGFKTMNLTDGIVEWVSADGSVISSAELQIVNAQIEKIGLVATGACANDKLEVSVLDAKSQSFLRPVGTMIKDELFDLLAAQNLQKLCKIHNISSKDLNGIVGVDTSAESDFTPTNKQFDAALEHISSSFIREIERFNTANVDGVSLVHNVEHGTGKVFVEVSVDGVLSDFATNHRQIEMVLAGAELRAFVSRKSKLKSYQLLLERTLGDACIEQVLEVFSENEIVGKNGHSSLNLQSNYAFKNSDEMLNWIIVILPKLLNKNLQ